MAETEPSLITGIAAQKSEKQGWNIEQVADALGVPPEDCTSDAWGMGKAFKLGAVQPLTMELYPDTRAIRVTGQDMQISLFRQEKPPVEAPEGGIAFELNGQPSGRFLSVSPRGEVLFQYDPDTAASTQQEQPQQGYVQRQPSPRAPEAKEKPRSEKYVGRMGAVRTHRTKAGKLVAEVEISIPDEERPGSSRLVKFAAFDLMAEVLQTRYHPGDEVVAVGIPHELKRRTRDGQEYTERQLYFVQPPKIRGGTN